MKNKKFFLVLSLIIFGSYFFVFSQKAQADVDNFKAYALMTPDTTPTIRGSIDAADVGATTITVQVEGGDVKNVTTIDADGNWSYTYTSAMTEGDYDYEAIATKGVDTLTINWTNGLSIDTENSYDIYWWGTSSDAVDFMEFPQGYVYTSAEEKFKFTFSSETKITKQGGGTFNVDEWYAEAVAVNNSRIINKIRFGVPNVTLSFSHSVSITFIVGSSYNGQTLHVFSRSDGGDDGWEPEITCVVSEGNCIFSIDHASYFAVSEFGSIAETEEGQTDDDDDEEDVEIDNVKYSSDQNSITVKWETNIKADSKVKYGLEKGNLNMDKKNKEKEKKHKIVLKNLNPNTQYFFKAHSHNEDDNSDSSKTYSIKTLAVASSNAENKAVKGAFTSANSNSDIKPNTCSYVVQDGDNLWSIAKKVYGDATNYPKIIESNPGISLSLKIGQELKFNCQ